MMINPGVWLFNNDDAMSLSYGQAVLATVTCKTGAEIGEIRIVVLLDGFCMRTLLSICSEV